MRAVVYVLALFAAIKIGAAEYLFRSGARDVIGSAYRERAIQACQRDGKSGTGPAALAAWSKPGEIRLVIGKSGLDVYLWQVDHQLWNARFRNPYLVILPAEGKAQGLVCEYDVVHNAALVSRL